MDGGREGRRERGRKRGRKRITDRSRSIKAQQKSARCCRADGTSRSSCGRLLKWLTSPYHPKCPIINAWDSPFSSCPWTCLIFSFFFPLFFISISNTAITDELLVTALPLKVVKIEINHKIHFQISSQALTYFFCPPPCIKDFYEAPKIKAFSLGSLLSTSKKLKLILV